MKLIQLILVPALLVLTFLYVFQLRSRLLDRLIIVVIGLSGMAIVIQPDWAQALAEILGVGRGADLVFYLGLVGLAFACFLLFSHIRQLEAKITEIVRQQAVDHAKLPPGVS